MGQHGYVICRPLKKDIKYRLLGEFNQPDNAEQHNLIDEAIKLTGAHAGEKYKRPLRRIAVYRDEIKPHKKRSKATDEELPNLELENEADEHVIELVTNSNQ